MTTTSSPRRTPAIAAVGGIAVLALAGAVLLLARAEASTAVAGIAALALAAAATAIAAARGIGARVRSDRLLRESESRLAEAQRIAGIGSWTWDPEGGKLEWSDELCRIFGLEPSQAPRSWQAHLELIHPGDRERTREAVDRACSEGVAREFDHRLIRRGDGETRILHCRVQSAADDRGRAETVHGTAQDVTAQRAAEAALIEAEERFRRAFEDSGSGMALVGLDNGGRGRFTEVNRALCEISGYSEDQLLQMRAWDLVHPEDAPGLRELGARLVSGELAPLEAEVRMIGAGGKRRWVAMTVSLARDRDGRPLHAIVQAQDISERKRFEGQLQYLADHDPLTGLYNRRRFEAELEREVATHARYRTGGAVLVLDVDNFKYANDSLGHAAGDRLLGNVARALRQRIRNTDIVARLGGDEFGVILPRADEHEARLVAADLGRVIREQVSVGGGIGAGRTTASIGVALFPPPGEPVEAEDLIVEADVAMYDAKEAGRDRVAVYDRRAGSRLRMHANLRWIDRIRAALEEDRFVLYAQPIAPLRGGGGRRRHELLARMVEPNGDLVLPNSFLRVAERSDLIEEIDRWVIAEAIRRLAAEQSRGNDVAFEVNVSAKSVGNPELPEWVASELRRQAVDPHGLTFEMTETEAIVNVERARTFAERLRTLGCEFALDDFGAGFASFYYLKHLSFDYLKIDGEFIDNLPRDRTDQMVVRAVVAIARGLGKQTIAEFVGDRETVELLRELGVDYAQGHWVGRPRPLSELELGAAAAVA